MNEVIIPIWNEPTISSENIIVIEKQRTFTLSNYYEPGSNQLEVFFNGLPAVKDYDYEEINYNTIRFTFNCEPPDIIGIRITRAG